MDENGWFLSEQHNILGNTAVNGKQVEKDSLPWGLSFVLQSAIDKPDSNAQDHFALRQLLLQAKPHRSKWYNPDRPGQGELYEALEKVLLDLKAFTPHSIPFLHRVSKKDVPDYHLIIRNPMDFGTMHKKLRTNQYDSKAQFSEDLTLIYENCITYNTAVDSPLRQAVKLLREKWRLLMAKVPDIHIGTFHCAGSLGSGVPVYTHDSPAVSSYQQSDGDDDMDMLLGRVESVDDLEDDQGDESCKQVLNEWPGRSPELMKAFTKAPVMFKNEMSYCDLAFAMNSVPDSRKFASGLGVKNVLFDPVGIEKHLSCVDSYSQLSGNDDAVLDYQNCTVKSRSDSLQFTTKIQDRHTVNITNQKLVALVLASHGVNADST